MILAVTGARGFIGRHVVEALRGSKVIELHRDNFASEWIDAAARADVIFHLAGVNRPADPAEFDKNQTLLAQMCSDLRQMRRTPVVVFASSSQATLDNPYGSSKRNAEDVLVRWAAECGGRAVVLRLKNVFGKWCRPNYNSVVATFCHNIARGLPIIVSEPARELELVYIDDVVAGFLECITQQPKEFERREIPRSHLVRLGALADLIRSFRESRTSLVLPKFDDEFTRQLYVTYLSYLAGSDFSYPLQQRTDQRGTLAEFMKSAAFGQVFVSRTRPGVTRGNHYHNSKAEKFLVVEGEAVIRFRPIRGTDVIEYRVSGREFRVVDIPPGYSHSIENVGIADLVTLFWSSEIFDPARPDTVLLPVLG